MAVSIVGMICITVLIALGHNSYMSSLLLGMNALGIGGGIYKSVKGGKTDGCEKEKQD